MKELWGADKLEAELEAAKDDLRGLEKNIRKILGRDVPEGENGTAPPAARVPPKRPLQEDRRRVNIDFPNNNEFGAKRRWQGSNNAEPKTVFSRLSARVPSTADDSGDEDDGTFKPAVSSRVIATPREIPSRQEVIRRESVDERSRQRNRRMFGALLGTLQKFRQEETKLKAKEDKKAEVEARVEEAKQREREQLKKERQQLFLTRKQRLAQVKALEIKLARSRQYQEWRSAQIPLLNFIKTKTAPHIYYLPKRPTPESDTLLQESSKELKAEIDRREKALVEDLERIQAQANFGRKQNERNRSMSENLDQSMTEEPEEEENRDPHPEKNGDVAMNEDAREAERLSNHEEHGKKEGDGELKTEKMDHDDENERHADSDKEKEAEADKQRKAKSAKRRRAGYDDNDSDSDEERDADSDKEKGGDSDKEKDSESDKESESEVEKEKESKSVKEKEAESDKEKESESDREMEVEPFKKKVAGVEKEKDAGSDGEKETDLEREKESESEKEQTDVSMQDDRADNIKSEENDD